MTADDAGPYGSWLRRVADAATALAALGLAAVTLAALVPRWPFALLEHFPVQIAAGGGVVVVSAAALRVWRSADVAAIATLVQLLWIAPDLCRDPQPIPTDGVALRVLVLNVHTEASSFAEVRRLIEDVRPDVIGLVEVDQRWLDALAPAVAGYPGRIEQPRSDNFGVALYARRRFAAAQIEQLGSPLPSAVARLALDDAELGIVLVHPLPPISAAALSAQLAAVDAIAERARKLAAPLVIMGDFNATPWSRPFRRLVAGTGLCDSRAGSGIAASFPADSAVLRIPIDHLLASCSVGIRGRRVERDVGSDHLPVVVDLVVPRAPSSHAPGAPASRD